MNIRYPYSIDSLLRLCGTNKEKKNSFRVSYAKKRENKTEFGMKTTEK